MDSPDSDDSETFTTPPGSVTAGIDSDRLQTECPDGVEAMEDEDKDDEWKSIMPEVWRFGYLVSFVSLRRAEVSIYVGMLTRRENYCLLVGMDPCDHNRYCTAEKNATPGAF